MVRRRLRKLNFQPSFSGKHNCVKRKAWLTLSEAGEEGLTLKELSERTGFGRKSLSVLVGRWCRWGYLSYKEQKGGRSYRLLKRGRLWLERWGS